MHRIIHGTLYERQPQACGHKVRIHDLGHGHVEVVALPHYQWREVADLRRWHWRTMRMSACGAS